MKSVSFRKAPKSQQKRFEWPNRAIYLIREHSKCLASDKNATPYGVFHLLFFRKIEKKHRVISLFLLKGLLKESLYV